MKNKRKKGFTLIEVIIAIALASTVLTMIIYMVVSAVDLHRKSSVLNTSVFLAENLMNEIKGKTDLPDKSGNFDDYPGYSYAYSTKEVEYDPFSGTSIDVSSKEQEIIDQYRENKTTGFSTGLIFRMNQYNVTIYYNEKYSYDLECLRGLKIEQTQQ